MVLTYKQINTDDGHRASLAGLLQQKTNTQDAVHEYVPVVQSLHSGHPAGLHWCWPHIVQGLLCSVHLLFTRHIIGSPQFCGEMVVTNVLTWYLAPNLYCTEAPSCHAAYSCDMPTKGWHAPAHTHLTDRYCLPLLPYAKIDIHGL